MLPMLFPPCTDTESPSSAMDRFVFNNFIPNQPNLVEKTTKKEVGPLLKDRQNFRLVFLWTKKFLSLVLLITGLVAVSFFLKEIWTRKEVGDDEVILTFSPSEVHIQDIPFPALTICNKNLIPKRLVQELQRSLTNYSNSRTTEGKRKYSQLRQQLTYVNRTCQQYQSFAKRFGFAQSRGVLDIVPTKVVPEISESEDGDGTADFWLKNSASCHNLIRLCLWKQEKINCSKLFKSVLTQFGKCCTFNSLPLKLHYRSERSQNSKLNEIEDKAEEGEDSVDESEDILPPGPIHESLTAEWTPDEIEAWKEWNYTMEFLLPGSDGHYPYRQEIPGVGNGLSILIDDETQEYFCPMGDSRGVRFKLHSPLESPLIEDFGAGIGISREVFVEVTPEVSMMHLETTTLPLSNRKCFLGNEKKLSFYHTYTMENCRQECLAKIILENCDCVPFYMPRRKSRRTCNLDLKDKDSQCVLNTKSTLSRNLSTECSGCWPLCMEVSYRSQSTVSTLQLRSQLWHDVDPKIWNEIPSWASNPMSIVHFYFGRATTIPRVRRVRTVTVISNNSTVELIAQTGGILSLCLGLSFTIWSVIDVIYAHICRSLSYPRSKEIWTWSCQKCPGGGGNERMESGDDVVVRISKDSMSLHEGAGYPRESMKTGSGTMSPLFPHYQPNHWIAREHSSASTPIKSV